MFPKAQGQPNAACSTFIRTLNLTEIAYSLALLPSHNTRAVILSASEKIAIGVVIVPVLVGVLVLVWELAQPVKNTPVE